MRSRSVPPRVIAPDELPPRADGPAGPDEPYTVAFECSGRGDAAEAALDQLDYAGTLVFVGTGHDCRASTTTA